jgi:DNA-binding NarL/FixJ family response regulator
LRLPPLDGRILKLLTDGENLSEIARTLHVSHTCIANHRRVIMRVAVKLGLTPQRPRVPRFAATRRGVVSFVGASPKDSRRRGGG